MASRTLYDKQSPHPAHADVAFSFAPAGTGAPTSVEGKGVSTVTRTGVGTFLVTLQDAWNALVAATGTLQLSAAADSVVQFGDYSASAKTLVVRVLTAGAAADVAANANNRVHVSLTLRNSSVA